MKPTMWLFAWLLCVAPAVVAMPSSACLIEKYNLYAKAKVDWQTNVTDLVMTTAPQYKTYSNLYLQDQLRSIALAKRAVNFLAEHAPYKLRTYMPLNQWLNLSHRDVRWISAEDATYARLMDEHQRSRKRAPHPDGDAIRALMRNQIMPSASYQSLLETLLAEVKRAEDMAC